MSGYRHASLLTMLQVAAYTALGIFEEGVALTTQESIPLFAFLPDLDGDVVLGHLVSTETGDLTSDTSQEWRWRAEWSSWGTRGTSGSRGADGAGAGADGCGDIPALSATT